MLYIFWFLHQTTTFVLTSILTAGCISFDSYIKPQLRRQVGCLIVKLYIFWFLHQTTTYRLARLLRMCCISFDSYIKPQLSKTQGRQRRGCISFDSYIKPQLLSLQTISYAVVYLLIPTSNHNYPRASNSCWGLYIFWFLHQTTTSFSVSSFDDKLYIFWFLHQTTTMMAALF